jgi:hypothetical protein
MRRLWKVPPGMSKVGLVSIGLYDWNILIVQIMLTGIVVKDRR